MTTWTARPIPPDSTDGVRTYWVDSEDGTPICDVHELNGKGKEHAYLLAAAPEMKASIQILLDALSRGADTVATAQATKQARAILAKLEGK
jgi:hypothetical protein